MAYRCTQAAQKAGVQNQKEWRRAQSLAQLFDAKLETIEKVLAAVEKPVDQQPKLLNPE